MSRKFEDIFTEKEWSRIICAMTLTPRQADIIRALFRGFNDKQIAEKLGLAFRTVRSHLDRMYDKFEVADRTALVLHVFCTHKGLAQAKKTDTINND